MKWVQLDKSDSSVYKGLAILLIVTHNFMHAFPMPKEMEFRFYEDRFFIFLDHFPKYEEIVRVFFSYFGHFGVQIFIFLSAYGLTKKYQKTTFDYIPYILRRFIVIYPSFLLAIFFWAIVDGFQYGWLGPLKAIYFNIDSIILRISLLSNFISGREFTITGPWWFISFIFQFYFFFPVLLRVHILHNHFGLFIVSMLCIAFLILTHGEIFGINLYVTIIGHLPELCLGIYLANKDYDNLTIPNFTIYIMIPLFLIGNIYEPFWHLTHISFLIILLAAFKVFFSTIQKNSSVFNFFIFFGSVSMPLFLVNGFLREPLISMAKDINDWLFTIIACSMFLTISTFVALILLRSEQYLMSFYNKKIN